MMINYGLNISIDTENGIVTIENDSVFTVEICAVPTNNRRKVRTQMVIHPKQAWIIDKLTDFNLKDYYIRFV